MWMFVSGMYGASAVAAGAAGAHMVKASSPEMKAVWQTGSQYHLAHSIMLASMAVGLKAGRKRNVVCGCFALGTLLFSGSCYAVVLKVDATHQCLTRWHHHRVAYQ